LLKNKAIVLSVCCQRAKKQ